MTAGATKAHQARILLILAELFSPARMGLSVELNVGIAHAPRGLPIATNYSPVYLPIAGLPAGDGESLSGSMMSSPLRLMVRVREVTSSPLM